MKRKQRFKKIKYINKAIKMAFNFDSETNVVVNKIPSAKAINKKFCKNKGAGLWIADDNMQSCGWRKTCEPDCDDVCNEHYYGTARHVISAAEDDIEGRGILNPRICVIRRTNLLRLNDKGKFMGNWVKGDGEKKDENGKKKFTCARRYLLVFVDEKNKPLHEDPIQLTAKGTFQVEFDKNLLAFRKDIVAAYSKAMKRRSGAMKELWYAMCVFAPTFESKLVGSQGMRSEACAVKSYIVPTDQDWLKLCVGRDMEVNEKISLAYDDSENWINKFTVRQISSPKKDDDEDSIFED